MRNGASLSQLLQVSSVPRGARMVRVVSMRVGAVMDKGSGKSAFDYSHAITGRAATANHRRHHGSTGKRI